MAVTQRQSVRISGEELVGRQHVVIALRNAIFGIGKTRALKICKDANVPTDRKVFDLTEEDVRALQEVVAQYKTGGPLLREILSNIDDMRRIRCYRGSRHAKHLTSRGQKTKTNAKTRRRLRGAVVGGNKKRGADK